MTKDKLEEFLESFPNEAFLSEDQGDWITKAQRLIKEREKLIYILGDTAAYMAHQQSEANMYRLPTPQFDHDFTLEIIRKSQTEINKILEE